MGGELEKPRSKPRRPLTEAARERFLEGLAAGLTVKDAAALTGHPGRTFEGWRERRPEFAERWRAAVAEGTDLLEREAQRRAVEGWLEPVVGKVAPGIDGHVRDAEGNPMYVVKYSDRLMEVLLKGRRPEYRDKPQVEVNNNTLNVSVEDRSASLAEIARVLAEAGVSPAAIGGGEVVDGEASEA